MEHEVRETFWEVNKTLYLLSTETKSLENELKLLDVTDLRQRSEDTFSFTIMIVGKRIFNEELQVK